MSVNKILVNNLDSNYTHSIFDISEYTSNSYSTLSDALDDVPIQKRKGGMTIRYVPTNDNKYVQYRLMSDTFNTTVSNWQGVDDEPMANSNNLVKSGGARKQIQEVNSIISSQSVGTIELDNIEEGKYYNAQGEKVSLASFNIAHYNVSGNVLFVYIEANTGSLSYILFFDSSDNILYALKGNSQNGIRAYVNIPNGCTHFGISYSVANGGTYVVGTNNIEKRLGDTEREIINNAQEIASKFGTLKSIVGTYLVFDSVVEGKYLDTNGDEVEFSTANINKYRIVYNTGSIHVKGRIGSVMAIWFYDINNSQISKIYGGTTFFDRDIVIPDNAAYIRIPYSTLITFSVTNVDDGSIINRLENNERSITDISKVLGSGLYYDSTEEDYYLNQNGQKVEYEGLNIKNYVLYNITSLHITTQKASSSYICFFDVNKKLIQSERGTSPYTSVDADFSVPDSAVILSVSYRADSECVVSAVNKGLFKDTQNKSDIWQGKKIGIIGDSIAVGFRADPTTNGFIYIAASILGTSLKNAAIGGWYLGDSDDNGVYRQVNGVSPSTKSLDGDEDLVIIAAGTNDFGRSYTIGEPYIVNADGSKSYNPDATTTCGGLALAIETLYTKYNGYIPIVICLPLHRNGGAFSSWDKNDADKYMDDYIKGIKDVAEFYGIPVCDLHNINMNPNIPAANTKYFDDGLHPNNAGHSLMGHILADFLKNNFFDL